MEAVINLFLPAKVGTRGAALLEERRPELSTRFKMRVDNFFPLCIMPVPLPNAPAPEHLSKECGRLGRRAQGFTPT